MYAPCCGGGGGGGGSVGRATPFLIPKERRNEAANVSIEKAASPPPPPIPQPAPPPNRNIR